MKLTRPLLGAGVVAACLGLGIGVASIAGATVSPAARTTPAHVLATTGGSSSSSTKHCPDSGSSGSSSSSTASSSSVV